MESAIVLVLVTSAAAVRLTPPGRAAELQARRTHVHVGGIDEAGVGAIAGPVIAAAVLLPSELSAESLAAAVDAKSLGGRGPRRDAMDVLVRRTPGLQWGIAALPAATVDAFGGGAQATRAAMRIAAMRLEKKLLRANGTAANPAVFYLVDGNVVPPGLNGAAIVRGDGVEASIAAASVLASATHDEAMASLSRRWQLWDLDVNLGWPSPHHLRAIVAHGPSGCHRQSCFPFTQRQGRRIAFHPSRAAYARIQKELRAASEPAEAEDGTAEDGTAEDEAVLARRQRYRDFVDARRSGTPPGCGPDATGEGAPASRTGGRRRRRRRRAERAEQPRTQRGQL